MADDREVLKEVWDGKLPVCFRLAREERFITEPEDIYLMVPRQTYFPVVTEKVHHYFSEFINPANRGNEMWLDYNGIALKWHYPVGLLYDLFVNDPKNRDESGLSFNGLPWIVNVHFSNFPEDELIHCSNKDIVESHFMSTIKEADALKHRGKVINAMQKRDHKQLWIGLQNDKFDQFWSVNKKLMEISEGDGFKNIPFRIYQNDRSFIQKLFQPSSDKGEKKNLSDLLRFIFGQEDFSNRTVLIQGITPTLDTPIQWLSEHLSYPDNFLHICFK